MKPLPRWMPPIRLSDMDKLHIAAELDDTNRDWQLLGYVTTDPTLRLVLFGQTADLPLCDVVQWDSLLVGAA